ncbi:MAG TPA: HEAT repeat domain-containing protein [Gemmatimonadaceae bacterium]|nr:HEAT repeat domain-containing protein [Gemmatimonadaceae bacterium]
MRVTFSGGVAALLLAAAPSLMEGQSIADRVRGVRNGVVHMSYAARPGVCGNGANSISFGPSRTMNWSGRYSSDEDEWEADECEPGPVRVSLTVNDGNVSRIRTYVGGGWRPPREGRPTPVDLGMVSVREATDYLLGITERDAGRAAKDAVLPAILADSVVVWPRLIRIARDDGRSRDVRKNAVFWLGHAAGEAAAAGLDSIVYASDVDREVREQAVFALSQRPKDEGVPLLIRVVRTNKDPEIKKKALFWLGQSGDPRALALFEEILTKQ